MAIDYQKELEVLPGATPLVWHRDGWWMEAPALDVVALAQRMLKWEARLSTMTGVALPKDETEVIYHYFLNQQAYNFKVVTQKNVLPSISTVLPAADWIEREIQDLYRTEFKNHPHPERLLRPIQLEPGFFREDGGAAGKNNRR